MKKLSVLVAAATMAFAGFAFADTTPVAASAAPTVTKQATHHCHCKKAHHCHCNSKAAQ